MTDTRAYWLDTMEKIAFPVLSALAEESGKVVRVGWYESAFHRTDQFGRRSGYGYEYQQRSDGADLP